MTDDGRFESINVDDEPGPGPRAVLLCGFGEEAACAAAGLLSSVGAPEHRVLRASKEMLSRPVAAALAEEDGAEPVPPEALPQLILLSGLTGRQIHGFIDGWGTTGLPTPIWASTTSHNLTRTLRELLQELLAERRAMSARG